MDERHFFIATGTLLNQPKPASDDILDHFKDVRGLQLPEAYVKLLKVQNGGWLRRSGYLDQEGEFIEVNRLGGIGPDRNDGIDLLDAGVLSGYGQEFPPETVLAFEANWPDCYALDYRQCGPYGEPTVVLIVCDEPPPYVEKIAANFDEFLGNLHYSEHAFVVGFRGEVDNVARLERVLENLLGVACKAYPEENSPGYRLRTDKWPELQYIDLIPNLDYATHRDGDKLAMEPAGPFFIEHPDCEWMLRCNVDESRFNWILSQLKDIRLDVVLLHQPLECLKGLEM